MKLRTKSAIWVSFLCVALSGPAMAADMSTDTHAKSNTTASVSSDEASNARETMAEAANVVKQLKANPETRQTLQQAKAVFIVPDYGRAALGIGGAGGQGVLMVNNDGTWSAPAFYNIGSVSLGLEGGVSGGSMAFLIMSNDALAGFRTEHNFSLNADAGLTIVNWSKRAQASAGKGADVIAWSDTEGLYGDLAVSVTDIFWDDEANQAMYQKNASAQAILDGNVQAPKAADKLESEFSALESAHPDTGTGNK